MTPMQEQYYAMKKDYADAILLFRLGDFYEAFNEDAEKISKILSITLTGRGKDESRIPMAGIPYHALPTYLPKLIEAGVKVAIADQMEEPVPGKLVERKVNKIITPGTVVDENSLEANKNNFIAALFISNNKTQSKYNFAYCDLTTGEFKLFATNELMSLKNELSKIDPSETLVSEVDREEIKTIIGKRYIQVLNERFFDEASTISILKEQFRVKTFKGFGLKENDSLLIPAGALVQYLNENQKVSLDHIKSLTKYSNSEFMQLDYETIRNLELIYPLNIDTKTSVYTALNECRSAGGQRKLRYWLINPLVDEEKISKRWDTVEFFLNDPILNAEVREMLYAMNDIERIAGRVGVKIASPKDLLALKQSLELALTTLEIVSNAADLPSRLKELMITFDKEVVVKAITIIENSIAVDAPPTLSEGGFIKDGVNKEVDELRNIKNNSKQILAEIQRREVLATGIPNLKVSFNKVFGYYIEITRSYVAKAPSHYIRKQTLANAERYIIQELKELEEKILTSEGKLIVLEQEIFKGVIEELSACLKQILILADNISEIDVLSNFGHVAKQYRYCKPKFDIAGNKTMKVVNGRHIVVERITNNFVANDVNFGKDQFIHLLTGPNMSGKSTYIRQVALITLLAQVGSFVPADEFTFSILDRIFTRVGASDNLAKGESTFMVEMSETANILNNATDRSLVILDEVGRGTSTYDGVAIAWSILEYLVAKIKCRTLFATHYHELTSLEEKFGVIANYNVQVSEKIQKDGSKEIMFMHKIIKGATDQSYGVHVAKIAGVPSVVTKRAEEILKSFEHSSSVEKSVNKSNPMKPKKIHPEQLGLI